MNIQYITEDGKKAFAVVPIDEFTALLELAEYKSDLQAIQNAAQEESFPADFVERLISGEHPLTVWREYRGLTQGELEEKSGVKQGYISQIENNKKPGGRETLKALAAALLCDVDDLIKSS